MSDREMLPGDLKLPFIFVPHGGPEPTEWMAAHPGWVKFPATFVPRGSADRPATDQVAAAGTTAATAARSGLAGEVATELLAAAGEAAAAVAAPLAAGAALLYPSHTASPDMDEVHPGREGFDMDPPTAPLPGLAPPTIRFPRPGEGGFPPMPALPLNPGFYEAPPLPPGLTGRPVEEQGPTLLHQERSDNGGGGARSRSQRAREAARKADPDVTNALPDKDWEAHHLINVAGLKVAPVLVKAAEKAGWRTDDPGNVAPLPASAEAQQKLKAAGIERPVHDSGHANWNAYVRDRLAQIRNGLRERLLRRGTAAYDRAAREELEKLQRELRRKMLELDRLTQSEWFAEPAPA